MALCLKRTDALGDGSDQCKASSLIMVPKTFINIFIIIIISLNILGALLSPYSLQFLHTSRYSGNNYGIKFVIYSNNIIKKENRRGKRDKKRRQWKEKDNNKRDTKKNIA